MTRDEVLAALAIHGGLDDVAEAVTALYADAERYRWLRANGKPAVVYLVHASPSIWDERIDAARAQ